MGDVLAHSLSSAQKFGGTADDYVPIHKFLDQSKLFIADWRHRALLHTTFGIALCEQMFGDLYVRPSDGVQVCTRTVATQHIIEDLGAVPTPEVFLREMPVRPWMNGFNKAQIKEMQNAKAIQCPPDKYEGHSPSCELRIEHDMTTCTCGVFAAQNQNRFFRCELCGKPDCNGHYGEGFQ